MTATASPTAASPAAAPGPSGDGAERRAQSMVSALIAAARANSPVLAELLRRDAWKNVPRNTQALRLTASATAAEYPGFALCASGFAHWYMLGGAAESAGYGGATTTLGRAMRQFQERTGGYGPESVMATNMLDTLMRARTLEDLARPLIRALSALRSATPGATAPNWSALALDLAAFETEQGEAVRLKWGRDFVHQRPKTAAGDEPETQEK